VRVMEFGLSAAAVKFCGGLLGAGMDMSNYENIAGIHKSLSTTTKFSTLPASSD